MKNLGARLFARPAKGAAPIASVLLLLTGAAVAASGDLDPGFGTAGRVLLDLGDQPSPSFSLTQQADGKLVLVGTIWADREERWMARLDSAGRLDATFGNGGIVIGSAPESAAMLVQQADGKLVVAGHAWSPGQDAALWRLDSAGRADASFGRHGKATLDLGGLESASSVVQQANDKLVIAGTAETTG